MKGNKDHNLNAAVKLNNEIAQERVDIEVTHVQALSHHSKSLEQLQEVDVPRIRLNIGQLESFSLKALKNKLNDENKRSQNQISKMKKNYEDLQKQIELTNKKIDVVHTEATTMKELFIKVNEDLERENEFKNSIEDKLLACDRDVNGDSKERGERSSKIIEGEEKTKSLNLVKKDILTSINKMVNQFNENNKLIKESNKVPKAEREMIELISRNNEI